MPSSFYLISLNWVQDKGDYVLGWWNGSSVKSACPAGVRPWVQTLVLPKKKKKNIPLIFEFVYYYYLKIIFY
jgi:hypothetical protein